jgi:hypothetical protein
VGLKRALSGSLLVSGGGTDDGSALIDIAGRNMVIERRDSWQQLPTEFLTEVRLLTVPALSLPPYCRWIS